mmetsp:Transcript_21119/g.68075  ORF Transcript_21119/g.68075 Transcript_21119/m.68075 type:complete len:308 (+) Transcript_21119:127-1050(+)
MMEGRPLCVVVEWFDAQRRAPREFLLKYYREEGQVEMFEGRRSFLKKSPAPTELRLSPLGSQVVLYARMLKVTAYADDYTKALLGGDGEGEEGCVVATEDFGKHLSEHADFVDVKLVELNGTELEELNKYVTCHERKVLAIRGKALGNADAGLKHLLFERPLARRTARHGNECTCCVIKPHVLLEKRAGDVVGLIEKHFEISALRLVTLDGDQANEFLEVYEGVLSDYDKHVEALTLGPCLALEIRGDNVTTFRDFCGPWDVDFAKELRPDSLRALFGKDNVHNAVHCTDLPEDGDSESRYFFQLLN